MKTSSLNKTSRFLFRWILAMAIFLLSFSFAMFQGGFVSWFLFYGLVVVFLFSSIIPFLSIVGLKLKRTVSKNNSEVGEALTIEVIIEKPAWMPFIYYHLSDTTPETFISERNHQLFSFSFDRQFVLSYEAKALQRGVYHFNEAIVHASDLFGLITIKRTLHSDREVVISPTFYAITNKRALFAYASKADHFHKGLQDDVLSSIRPYVSGDRLSKIDWKRSAGVNGLLTKEFETEEDQHVEIVHAAQEMDALRDPIQYEESIKEAVSIHAAFIQDHIHTTLSVYNEEWIRTVVTFNDWRHSLRLFALIHPVPDHETTLPLLKNDQGICFIVTPRFSKMAIDLIRKHVSHQRRVFIVTSVALAQEEIAEVSKAGGHVFIPQYQHSEDHKRGEFYGA
ncbi:MULTISPECIES: DUF58 domain-containing protein [Shouchella]|uniref:DUF58 domain-containing protein n=3 Tax=Bacillaceae TaxID=186817 RepID=A0A060M543_9BACI|nr:MULTISPECIES: DUF58 domain-containing protein [Bacillaceae]AIC95673.1 hypothetical protein BleG1_3109 [Shouchella lehensis G1]KQL57078.1 hypothetical protein AN965_10415 [Alkalicoccobacillus plakortidis]MBG9783633.1 hypothetical protein [Shouchella lehensis]TES51418.1 DUF58 domain-containing protein [Shouchella lehensis]